MVEVVEQPEHLLGMVDALKRDPAAWVESAAGEFFYACQDTLYDSEAVGSSE